MTQILKKADNCKGNNRFGLVSEGNSSFLKLVIKIIWEFIDPAQTYFKTADHWLQWDKKTPHNVELSWTWVKFVEDQKKNSLRLDKPFIVSSLCEAGCQQAPCIALGHGELRPRGRVVIPCLVYADKIAWSQFELPNETVPVVGQPQWHIWGQQAPPVLAGGSSGKASTAWLL